MLINTYVYIHQFRKEEKQRVPGPVFPPIDPIARTAQISETHTLITGIDGYGDWGMGMGDPFTYLFDGSEFHRKADPQLDWGSGDTACSVMADGRVMLVGSTDNSADNMRIYNPLENTWIDGPSIPEVEPCGAMILDGNDLILIEEDAFYRLSLFSDKWETLDTKLAHGRAWFPAVKFENSNIDC